MLSKNMEVNNMEVNNMSNTSRTKVIMGAVRLSYANGWESKSMNNDKKRYSISTIIPKNDQKIIKKTQKVVDVVIKASFYKFNRKVLKEAIELPSRDHGTEKDNKAYANAYFLNANSMIALQIVDKCVESILDRNIVYFDAYTRVSLSLYAYNINGNKSIAVVLKIFKSKRWSAFRK